MNFDNTSTANDVLAGVDLTGKTAMVTGASGGIGEETSAALLAHGAEVTILGRSETKLSAAASRIKEATGKDVEMGVLELSKPATIQAFAEDWLSRHSKLDILINNAGIMMCPLQRTSEGWEMQFATNHLGHFLLTNLMIPALKNAGGARVVSVASAGHAVAGVDFDDIHYEQRDYDPINAYGQSKTANVWFANELDRRFKDHAIRAFSLHPGGVQTDLGRYLTPDVLDQIMKFVNEAAEAGDGESSKTVAQGAATSCYAAASPELEGKGGLYLVDSGIAEAGGSIFKSPSNWAYDEEGEARLWAVSNSLLNTNFWLRRNSSSSNSADRA